MRKFALDRYDIGMLLGTTVLYGLHLCGADVMPESILEAFVYLMLGCFSLAGMNWLFHGYKS